MSGRGLCIWFTGRPCSGKTTIASAVAEALTSAGRVVTMLDGDHIRSILCPDLGFSEEDRLENLRRISFVAREVVRHGGLAIVATVSPFAAHREVIRASFPLGTFLQVYIKASLEECERRDVKGLYARAKSGELENFTGVGSPYQEPLDSEVVCDTEHTSVEECAKLVMAGLATI